jgi:hypothetical protein
VATTQTAGQWNASKRKLDGDEDDRGVEAKVAKLEDSENLTPADSEKTSPAENKETAAAAKLSSEKTCCCKRRIDDNEVYGAGEVTPAKFQRNEDSAVANSPLYSDSSFCVCRQKVDKDEVSNETEGETNTSKLEENKDSLTAQSSANSSSCGQWNNDGDGKSERKEADDVYRYT